MNGNIGEETEDAEIKSTGTEENGPNNTSEKTYAFENAVTEVSKKEEAIENGPKKYESRDYETDIKTTDTHNENTDENIRSQVDRILKMFNVTSLEDIIRAKQVLKITKIDPSQADKFFAGENPLESDQRRYYVVF